MYYRQETAYLSVNRETPIFVYIRDNERLNDRDYAEGHAFEQYDWLTQFSFDLSFDNKIFLNENGVKT